MLLSESYAPFGALSPFRLRSGFVRAPLLLLSVLSESHVSFGFFYFVQAPASERSIGVPCLFRRLNVEA